MTLKTDVISAVVFGLALGVAGILAYQALRHQGELNVEIDPNEGVIKLAAKGSATKGLTEVLDEAWKKDKTISRGILSAWGLIHSFISVEDEDGLKKFELIKSRDFEQIRLALTSRHVEKWPDLLRLSTDLKSRVAPIVVPVTITYGASDAINDGYLRFRRGDRNLRDLINRSCTLKPLNSEVKLDLVIEMGIDLPEGHVQIQDTDFVRIVSHLNNFDAPDRNTPAWRSILKVGKVRGEVWL